MSRAALDHALLQELVAAFVDDELPPDEALIVEQHLRDCGRCQRELALQQGLASALAHAPPEIASANLRRRIEQIGLPAPRRQVFRRIRWAAPLAGAAAAIAILVAAASVSIERGPATSAGEARNPVAGIPLLRDAVADCRRAMSRNFPRRADVAGVANGLGFPVRALERLDVQLFSTWQTTLAGSPAAGLAYRWRGIVVVQYAVAPEIVRQQPDMGGALRAGGSYSAFDREQGIVAFLADGAGTLLLADAPPEELSELIH